MQTNFFYKKKLVFLNSNCYFWSVSPPSLHRPPAVAVCYIEAILVTFIFQWNGSNIKLAKPAKLDPREAGGGPGTLTGER